MPELAGDPDAPGTCRNRQKWVPQAWKEAEQQAGAILKPSPLSSKDDREAAKFVDGVRNGVCREGIGEGDGAGAGGDGGQQGLVYDLLSVVVHRGSAYSGHYHAFIRDCLQEVRRVVQLLYMYIFTWYTYLVAFNKEQKKKSAN